MKSLVFCIFAMFLLFISPYSSTPVGFSNLSSNNPVFSPLSKEKELFRLPEMFGKKTVNFIAQPPKGKFYHGVHPNTTGNEGNITLENINSYISLSGKKVAWVYFSNEWSVNRSFPFEISENIRDIGSIPYIRLMLRSDTAQYQNESLYTLDAINSGQFDDSLKNWSISAAHFKTPIIAEYGTEVNGEWFSWNAKWNGEQEGADKFINAYRRIINISREEEANNILWVFHVDDSDIPNQTWNRMERYYPGDDWVDWIGVSIYGAQKPFEKNWPLFSNMMDKVYPRLIKMSPDKPIIVAEFGVTQGYPDKDQAIWADNALKNLIKGRWQNVIGFSWWNGEWPNDGNTENNSVMSLEANPALNYVFNRTIGKNPSVLDRVIVTQRKKIVK